MGLPILCIVAALFAFIWGSQNIVRNPVPSAVIVIGVVGLSYYLLDLAHYHKLATSILVGIAALSCGRVIRKMLFP
ncbi:hypothetical protein QUF99_26450 [Bacillus sp. DX4.1]|uniref:hypothetical protein n=1 Tax=Bacillus sp. DX4.1 TaxID=3055867 RepID=UPI0025A2004D|nr:hypothetical protein [Bacillus sp. DX4.1]MDM5190742.1 hypothetical protein [Bacillus sp. DX4.1]